jgi:hypothetical protein
MLLEDIAGITNLDAISPIFDKESNILLGALSLCHILLCYLGLSDGHQLIAEVHQSNDIMGPVQAVIPNTPEAERMTLMMNKIVPTYIGNILKDQRMLELFLMDLVKNFSCPTQVSEIMICTWNPDTGTLMTRQEAAEEDNPLVLETAPWFHDVFTELGACKKEKPRKQVLPP